MRTCFVGNEVVKVCDSSYLSPSLRKRALLDIKPLSTEELIQFTLIFTRRIRSVYLHRCRVSESGLSFSDSLKIDSRV